MSSQLLPAEWEFSRPAATQKEEPSAHASSIGGGAPAERLRGMLVPSELRAGAVALSLPAKLLISYETAAASDFGAALNALPSLKVRGSPEGSPGGSCGGSYGESMLSSVLACIHMARRA